MFTFTRLPSAQFSRRLAAQFSDWTTKTDSSSASSRKATSTSPKTSSNPRNTLFDDSYRARPVGRWPGQNLSDRYLRLERSLRSKSQLTSTIPTVKTVPFVGQAGGKFAIPKADQIIFRGLVIPKEPKEPQSDGIFPSSNLSRLTM